MDFLKTGSAAADESAGGIAVRLVVKRVEATVEDLDVALSPKRILLNTVEGFETFAAKAEASNRVALGGPSAVQSPDRRMNEAW